MTTKISAVEAGKIGGANSAINSKIRMNERIIEYNLNPIRCTGCKKGLPYHKRKQKFCGHSCRAKCQNPKRGKKIIWTCLGCGKTKTVLSHTKKNYNNNKSKKYCGNDCQAMKIEKDTDILFEQGLLKDRTAIKKKLIARHGEHCFNCKRTEWQGVKIPLEVHHINGPGDDLPSSLQLLCPNCHALTPNYKGKNKGNGRAAQGLPLY